MNFGSISARDLEALATGLEDGRLSLPPAALSLERLGLSASGDMRARLRTLSELGFAPSQAALMIRVALAERKRAASDVAKVEPVITGPDPASAGRDTAVVVRDLFAEAREEILVAGFALHQGQVIFKDLAERHDREPNLRVLLCLDVSRRAGDTTRNTDLLLRFAATFRSENWPGKRLPAIHYDPRGLDLDHRTRAVLHAKCIVVDRRKALVTSANLTLAAQRKNIELGVVIEGGDTPRRIAAHFESLIASGHLRPVAI